MVIRMKRVVIFMVLISLVALTSSRCKQNAQIYQAGDWRLHLEPGVHYLHDFPLFLGIHIHNPPQYVIWLQDGQGRYLRTLHCTHRSAKAAWRAAPKDPNKGRLIQREEALPYWSHQRNQPNPDGTYMPAANTPLPDAISGATPKEHPAHTIHPPDTLNSYWVMLEINHSADFNSNYPKHARPGDKGYSGGPFGSGQPALVYGVQIFPDSNKQRYALQLQGHSSPDGHAGTLTDTLHTITTARHILAEAHVEKVHPKP